MLATLQLRQRRSKGGEQSSFTEFVSQFEFAGGAIAATMAATNKCLAQSNKSRTGREATKKRFSQSMGIEWALIAMTLQEAKSIARHLGLTLRTVRSGDYRVNFRDGNEATAYYTDNLEDAVNTVVEKAHKRGLGAAPSSGQPFKTE
jgi:hypothetical protein